ncbi:MAG TPA: sigma-70 family RNA polymerase sigma factor [Streptosporangiaceae bacterium]|nr:sigma-70 family RNA polymerase sigma factor [Streptosporangiaceae bacterium]
MCRDANFTPAAMNARRLPGVVAVVGSSGCDDLAVTWMTSYRRPLLGFVLPYVNGDVQAAEDVVQETMLRGWQHATELSPEHAKSWLHTVARNIAISSYQRRRRVRPREVPLEEEALPQADDGLDRVVDGWVVAGALDAIGPEHRDVITALFYQRKSVAEVAELMDIPEGTVRSRCFYGLRALRRELERQGITSP